MSVATMSNLTVKQSQSQTFLVRNSDEPLAWAVITFADVQKESGILQIISDYGSWSYRWTHCGMPFSAFLKTVGKDYMADKFRERGFYLADETEKEVKGQILEYRRRWGMEKKESRDMYNILLQVDFYSEESARREILEHDDLYKFFNGDVPMRRGYSPQFTYFWDVIWQPFVAHL